MKALAVQSQGRPEGGGDVEKIFLIVVILHAPVGMKEAARYGAGPAGDRGLFAELLLRRAGENGEEPEKEAEGGNVAFRFARTHQPAVFRGNAVGGDDAVSGRSFEGQSQRVAREGDVEAELTEQEGKKLPFAAGKFPDGVFVVRGKGEAQGVERKDVQQRRLRRGKGRRG